MPTSTPLTKAIYANFSGKARVAKHLSGRDGGDDPALSQHLRDMSNKDQKRHGEEMVAVADRVAWL